MEENGYNTTLNAEEQKASKEQTDIDIKWYVVHTYSGYEDKVMKDILRVAGQRGLADRIVDACVPLDSVVEVKADKEPKKSSGGKNPKSKEASAPRRTYQRKKYPGYVMVKMHMDDQTWTLVRNTRGVTGFVGTGNTPVPLTDEEVVKMGIEYIQIKMDINPGDYVEVTADAFRGLQGKVMSVNPDTMELSVEIEFMGRLAPIEVRFCDVRKL